MPKRKPCPTCQAAGDCEHRVRRPRKPKIDDNGVPIPTKAKVKAPRTPKVKVVKAAVVNVPVDPSDNKPEGCRGCPLAGCGRGFALGRGDPRTARVAFQAEAPGDSELSWVVDDAEAKVRKRDYPTLSVKQWRIGAPLVGPSGGWLEAWFVNVGGLAGVPAFVDNSIRCLGYGTRVWMGDGSWKKIQYIQEGESVWGVVNGEAKVCKVLAVTRTPNRKKWLCVDVDGGHRRNQNGNKGVYCTPDHNWYTTAGKKRADEIQVGDKIYLPQFGSEDLIQGTLLGDAHARDDGQLILTHSNEGWARAKAENFGADVRCRKEKSAWAKKDGLSWSFNHRIPRTWRNRIYEGKQKRWQDPISDAALAVLFGDDGCIDGTGAKIAVQKFPKQDWERILLYFRGRFGKASISRHGNLSISVRSARRFWAAISPWLHPSVQYKMAPEYHGQYNGWMEKRQLLVGEVLSVTVVKGPKNSEMCLVVDEAQNFFTRCGLVSNCIAPMSKDGSAYPKGQMKKDAEAHCRRYDRWDSFFAGHLRADVVTIHPAALIRELTPLPLVTAVTSVPGYTSDMGKVAEMVKLGIRVRVLAGGKAAAQALGYGGNVQRYRGHYTFPMVQGTIKSHHDTFAIDARALAATLPRRVVQSVI